MEVGFLRPFELVLERVVAAIEAIEVVLHGSERIFGYLRVEAVLRPGRAPCALGTRCAIARFVY